MIVVVFRCFSMDAVVVIVVGGTLDVGVAL